MDPTYSWIALACAATATVLFSLAQGALGAYSLARFEALLEDDEAHKERLLRLLEDEERLILACTLLRGIFLCAGVVSLTGALIGRTQAAGPLPVPAWTWVLVGAEAMAISAGLLVGLCSIVPRAVGAGQAELVLLRLELFLSALNRLAHPLIWFFGGLTRVFLRVFDVRELDEKEEARDEILSAALAGENEGAIDEATKDVIENLMEFRHADVSEVMTPRIEIVSVDAAASLQDMVAVALEHERSRLPVTEGSLDKIVGILMVKDLLRALTNDEEDPRSLFRKPLFVPETKPVADLLKELRTLKTHMAIVADEYGGTAGLVTIEDLIEEIIGEIDDEHDKPELPPVRRVSDSTLDADAKVHIDVLNEDFGTKIPEDEDVETLGGFIALLLGRIPQAGDRVVHNGATFVVTEADERRVSRVTVTFRAKRAS